MTAPRTPVGTVSVVVPVLDQARELSQQLEHVLGQESGTPFEVVVADNGSTDDSVPVAHAFARADERVVTVDASARPGPAAARNIGVSAATGDALVFCDADDVVAPGWLAACVRALEDCDAVAGTFDFASLSGGSSAAGVDVYSAEHFGFLPAGLGANLAVRADAFRAVGGFDESMRAGEDIDLCWRLQLAGYEFTSTPDAVVAKRERADAAARNRQQFAYGRHDARLYRRFRTAGMRRDVRLTVRTWAWLVLNAPWAGVSPRRRETWARAWYLRVGRLVGSWEQRVFYP
jgi:glycosyltransferase involved in cell wall biosynthesis